MNAGPKWQLSIIFAHKYCWSFSTAFEADSIVPPSMAFLRVKIAAYSGVCAEIFKGAGWGGQGVERG